MEPGDIHAVLKESFGDAVSDLSAANCRPPHVKVPAEKLIQVLTFMRDHEGLEFDALSCLSAVDYPPDEKKGEKGKIQVVYHLLSIKHKHSFAIKIELDRNAPVAASATVVFPAADWFEREASELYGMQFEGHPDPRRLLLPDDWEGTPMRKDYVFPEQYHGVKV